MTLPNFLIIGAAKSGTTALTLYLSQHPQIYMCPIKETCFFNFVDHRPNFKGPKDELLNQRIISNLSDYVGLFSGASDEIAIGEASVWYLYCEDAPENIHSIIPDARLIAVLRNPVDRAYSSYLMTVKHGRESFSSFIRALQEENKRINANWEYIWHYIRAGFYFEQLRRYFDIFDSSQIRVYVYDDFRDTPTRVMTDIFNFLEVDPHFCPDMSLRPMATGIPRSKFIEEILSRPNRVKKLVGRFMPKRLRHHLRTYINRKNLIKQELPEPIRTRLMELYREDILRLQDLLERDFSIWLR